MNKRGMNWKEAISDFSVQAQYLRKIKRTKNGVIGHFSFYTPEEIIYGAGFLPYQLFSVNGLSDIGGCGLKGPCCSFTRELSRSNIYKDPLVDGFVFPAVCDSLRNLYCLWKPQAADKFIYTINNPHFVTEESIRFFQEELNRFIESFEKYFNLLIQRHAIADAIKLCNKNRRMLQVLFDSRKTSHPAITGSEMAGLSMLSKIIDKKEANDFIFSFLEERTKNPLTFLNKKRLMVVGPVIDGIELFQAIESLGGAIVLEEIMNGPGSFNFQIDTSSEDLFYNLAKGYLEGVASAVLYPDARRIERMLNDIKEYNVQGVIFVVMKSCEPYFFLYAKLKELLGEKHIPTLCLEIEHAYLSNSSLLLRVETFLKGLK